jgi:hypothetical protein
VSTEVDHPIISSALQSLLTTLWNSTAGNGTAPFLTSFVNSAAVASGILPKAVTTTFSVGTPVFVAASSVASSAVGSSSSLSGLFPVIIGVTLGSAVICALVIAMLLFAWHKRKRPNIRPAALPEIGEAAAVFGINPMQAARLDVKPVSIAYMQSDSVRVLPHSAAARVSMDSSRAAAARHLPAALQHASNPMLMTRAGPGSASRSAASSRNPASARHNSSPSVNTGALRGVLQPPRNRPAASISSVGISSDEKGGQRNTNGEREPVEEFSNPIHAARSRRASSARERSAAVVHASVSGYDEQGTANDDSEAAVQVAEDPSPSTLV